MNLAQMRLKLILQIFNLICMKKHLEKWESFILYIHMYVCIYAIRVSYKLIRQDFN